MTLRDTLRFIIAMIGFIAWPFAVIGGCRVLYLWLCEFTVALGISVTPGMFSAQAIFGAMIGFVAVTAIMAAVFGHLAN